MRFLRRKGKTSGAEFLRGFSAGLLLTCPADLQVKREDGVGAGGVLVHQRGAHSPVPAASLHHPLALPNTVHGVHGEVAHVNPPLWMLFQLLSVIHPGKKRRGMKTRPDAFPTVPLFL